MKLNKDNFFDICIIGGGASGLTTAVQIKKIDRNLKVAIFEKNDKIGKKIRATGNGKCNISNYKTTTFGDTVKFFRDMAVDIKSLDDGRAYPVSERAEDVVTAFELQLKLLGVDIFTNCNIEKIEKNKENFEVHGDGRVFYCKKLVLATGGKSGSQYGSTGDGFKFAKGLGHNVTRLKPILAPIECENEYLKDLKGIRVKGSCGLYIGNHQELLEFGEIQFTEYGLSGICIFNLTRGIDIDEDKQFKDYHIRLNLLTKYTFIEIYYILKNRSQMEEFKTENLMLSIVNEKISKQVLSKWSKDKPMAKDLTKEELELIVYEFMNLSFEVKGIKGWQFAQGTGGGITFSEFNYETMESNICKDLYIVGELIDYDENCGGYNLENAWNTGRKAGKDICIQLAK